jgi:hypothetical protein
MLCEVFPLSRLVSRGKDSRKIVLTPTTLPDQAMLTPRSSDIIMASLDFVTFCPQTLGQTKIIQDIPEESARPC